MVQTTMLSRKLVSRIAEREINEKSEVKSLLLNYENAFTTNEQPDTSAHLN